MTVQVIKNVITTWVQEDRASSNMAQNSNIALVNNTGAADREGLITFPLPAPRGAKYNSAKLRLFNMEEWAGSRTVTIYAVTAPWSASLVRWDNKPARTVTNAVSVTKSGAAAWTTWEFDITTLLNLASAGAAWYGFYIVVTSTAENTVRNMTSERSGYVDSTPQLEVSWSTAPEKPTQVSPSGGRYVSIGQPYVTADFIDKNGSTELAAMQILVSSSSNMSSPWDSGEIVTDVPQVDLATTNFVNVVSGQTRYMQVRVKDGDNNWSPYSDIVIWKVASKGTLTITSPSAPPDNVTGDVTPRFTWTFSGQTQRSWQVLVFKKDGYQLMYDSGKITSAALEYTPTIPLPLYDEDTIYVLEIRVWDALDRVTTANDKAYVVQTREFTLELSAALQPVTNLAVAEPTNPELPWRVINWKRSTAPDFFDILRDGQVILLNATPASLSEGGTSYSYVDKSAQPRQQHTWTVVAKTNQAASKTNPTATDTIVPTTAWLCSRLDDTIAIPLFNYSNSLSLDETTGSYKVLGSDEEFIVYQSARGFAGEFSGMISNAIGDGVTAADYLKQLMVLRSARGKEMVLTFADQRVVCKVYEIDYFPVIYKEEITYQIKFKLAQKKEVR